MKLFLSHVDDFYTINKTIFTVIDVLLILIKFHII